jgi:uncharacterized protein YjbI with pentapeptide repeats
VSLQPARSLHAELRLALDKTERLTLGSPEALLPLDVNSHRDTVNALLVRASTLARAGTRRREIDRRGADLVAKNLRSANLQGANLKVRP